MNRLERSLDGVLLLLDRQILDNEGLMVAKVDDVELLESRGGDLVISGLLTGSAALVPRLGGKWGQALYLLWAEMGRQYADRSIPGWIGLDKVDRLESAVILNAPRDELIVPQPVNDDRKPRRLGDLLGMHVHFDGGQAGKVLDVRFEQPEHDDQMAVSALIVGRGRPGSRLGYDRHPERGPRLLSILLHSLQHDRGLVDTRDVKLIDWDRNLVTITRAPVALDGN